jgi:uncharacterized protein (TIGR03067 family)
MNPIRPAFVFALVLLVAALAWSQDTAGEQKALEGTWIPSAAEIAGQPFPEDLRKKTKLVVAGDKYTVHVGDTVDRGTVKIDTSKKPKTMDIIGAEGPNKGKTFLAIYELNGDTLRVCYNLGGKERPAEFKTTKDSLVFLATYQRAK